MAKSEAETKKSPTHTVVHPKQYFMVGGKMQKVPVGTPICLSEKRAKKLGNKVKLIVNIPTLETETPASS